MTSESLPEIHIVRHGETAWTKSRRHTGLSDIPLTERGEQQARLLGNYLEGGAYQHVFTSPLQRASRTCELAGFGGRAQIDPDLVEWNYGEYDGLTTEEIRKLRPSWHVFRDGCPGGESVAEVAARADRVVRRLRELNANVLLFSSGHFTRVFAARWLGLEPSCGRLFMLSTTTLSILGYEHTTSAPAIRLWNDVRPGEDRKTEE